MAPKENKEKSLYICYTNESKPSTRNDHGKLNPNNP